ncbi:hypothetical protein [Paenibacillus aestuarii]|uniref:Signal peptide protein n=1 Tax=Paenibacillus aestuarii TaxID=516965 RepID=A0ABW0KEX4_9BACL|nr:hypothetical protein [Paenibacillus aestuarii]
MKQTRFWLMAAVIVFAIFVIWGIMGIFHKKPSAMSAASTASGNSGTSANVAGSNNMPWDYQIQEAKVGDLLDGDMLLLPNQERISNDQNFATGDQVWVLRYMNAAFTTNDQGKNDVTLSQWKPIKTYKTKEEADKDLADLKTEIKTDVHLVGEYKTELDGNFRYFAVVDMPTGQKVKQPISEERYAKLKGKENVSVVIEEVHDYSDYDLSMAKFRGWAD